MLTRLLVLLCLLSAIVLAGCATSEPANSNATTANANKAATTPATTAPATTAPATASAGEKIGVPECDEYLTNYDACISSKVPEVARAQYKTAIDQTRASWRKLAENPATKGSLAAACKQAADAQRTAMKSYGCTF